MNVALFGGTFDPVHLGHLVVARAAQQRFDLGRVYFVPAFAPPHKQGRALTPFHHRYAMLALATQGHKDFIPSLVEGPDSEGRLRSGANYSIDTVRLFKATLKKNDRLFFLIGIDAFMDIAKWREPEALLRECEFIVVSRPGFSLADVAEALPESMRPNAAVLKPFRKQAAQGDIVLGGAAIHLLTGVDEPASATKVREAAARGRSAARWLDPAVAEYIGKMRLYRAAGPGRKPAQTGGQTKVGGTQLHVIQGGKKAARVVEQAPPVSGHPHEER
jgi:nicotinate-nucleotide adenylyltransferase